jgi:hypothetical protein
MTSSKKYGQTAQAINVGGGALKLVIYAARNNIENLRICAPQRTLLVILPGVSYACITFYVATADAGSLDPSNEATGGRIRETILDMGDAR